MRFLDTPYAVSTDFVVCACRTCLHASSAGITSEVRRRRYQKQLASALLAAGLSETGYKAVTIMSLEDVLKALENDNGARRDPEKYHFTVFGTPSDTGTCG